MHVIAAKRSALARRSGPSSGVPAAGRPERQGALRGDEENGYRIISGTTENHLMLVDLRPNDITGKEAQETLDRAGITVNKNAIRSHRLAVQGGGIRLGTPASPRADETDEMFDIANLIDEALKGAPTPPSMAAIQGMVARSPPGSASLLRKS